MNDLAKTTIFVVLAAVLCGAAYLTRPSTPVPEYFSDQGTPFYPEFVDPLAAASLEVIDFDEDSGQARPFKVQLQDGVWSIPSHHHYPADGKERLAKTAAGVIGLRKDTKRSDRAQDHETLGVIGPLDDTTPNLKGRGQRVTLRDAAGSVLADFIFGKEVEGRDGYRYVRVPSKKRTYAAKVDVDISTRFADWIETNLLDVAVSNIATLAINDYSVDEATGTLEQADNVHLRKSEDLKWKMNGLPETRELDESKVNKMASSLSGITITGVRPKPESLSRDLRTKQGMSIDPFTQLSLQSKGFFVSRDGRLLSNEGELRLGTPAGVDYTLRFGEVIFGDGLDVSAGAEEGAANEGDQPDNAESSGGTENRYLFVTAEFNESLLPPRPAPPVELEPADEPGLPLPADDAEEDDAAAAEDDTDAAQEKYAQELEAWEQKVSDGREEAAKLNDRFAPWYFVISGTDFNNIRLDRNQLIKAESEDEQD
ncbi:MAG: DUF4340 domain-containing protein [bacterium]|nr:DUF4340 domain-containing protein [bacterium]